MSISTLQALPTPLGTEKGVRATGVMLMYLICSCKNLSADLQMEKWTLSCLGGTRVCSQCVLNADAKETPRNATGDQGWGQSEGPSNQPNSKVAMAPAKLPVTKSVTSCPLSSSGQSKLAMKSPEAGSGWTFWFQILAFPLMSHVIWGKFYLHSVLQFHPLSDRDHNQI